MANNVADTLRYFRQRTSELRGNIGAAGGQKAYETREGGRSWEDYYRRRWQHDKIVRSTHGVNCTGSCSFDVYVKDGVIVWETQKTDYPSPHPEFPEYEPRGCPRGLTASWYVYSPLRIKYPYIRSALLELWREAKAAHGDAVSAWQSIRNDPEKRLRYQRLRGKGGLVRCSWDEANELVAASLISTIDTYGPDRIFGFTPLPAMSMASFASGSRFLTMIGASMVSFYDWYCDLPPASPQIWGEQTDVPESADWYNSGYIIAWGSNLPQTRTPDAHFYTEARYRGTQIAAVSPDYANYTKFADHWLGARAGTDGALAMAMNHVLVREYYLEKRVPYFEDYARAYTDLPYLVLLDEEADAAPAANSGAAPDAAADTVPGATTGGAPGATQKDRTDGTPEDRQDAAFSPGRFARLSDLGQDGGNPEWKCLVYDRNRRGAAAPNGSIGSRHGDDGLWNMDMKDVRDGADLDPVLSMADLAAPEVEWVRVRLPRFDQEGPALRRIALPALRLKLINEKGEAAERLVTTVFDLMAANLGLERAPGSSTPDYADAKAYATPAWQESVTGVPADQMLAVIRGFADNAVRTKGRSMIIVGAGINHWYNNDMTYRSVLSLLLLCGCQGVPGGGWAHYVGQEKVRPQAGWAALAMAGDWMGPPRLMNGTSFYYFALDSWRHELLDMRDYVIPNKYGRAIPAHPADCNALAARLGWLPFYPQFGESSLRAVEKAEAAGASTTEEIIAHSVKRLKSGDLPMAVDKPDAEENVPRVMFFWRANPLGSNVKGHEYFLKYLLGCDNSVLAGPSRVTPEMPGGPAPGEPGGLEGGKLDLMVTTEIRMSTTCLYSDIVLPAAHWYESHDLSSTDMHPFIHPFTPATDPAWESKSNWRQFEDLARVFSEMAGRHLGVRRDLVATPLQHDSPDELAQPFGEVRDWRKEECEATPGKSMFNLCVVERRYPDIHKMYSALGPRVAQPEGVGSKGVRWSCAPEYEELKQRLGVVAEQGLSKGMPRIKDAKDACEIILALSPESNGRVGLRSWESLEKKTGKRLRQLSEPVEELCMTFDEVAAQPRKSFVSPVWSGLEGKNKTYAPFELNLSFSVPFRTLTGRQHFYLDHHWMQALGESLATYKPPLQLSKLGETSGGRVPENKGGLVLNYLTPHSKWSIHSTYSDNLLMRVLSRGGGEIWLNNQDAASAGIADNDWLECYNANGVFMGRAVVSHRIPQGKTFVHHAQERHVHVPLSPMSGQRGGSHNSLTRTLVKPTQMIGGYAQLSYGFNYYGPTGCQRDEFIIIRKAGEVRFDDH